MRYRWVVLICALTGWWASDACAGLHAEMIEYRLGETVMEGYLAYDDALEGRRPGVLVIHEWKGLNEYAKRRADQLAQLGYLAFAADIYGKGVRPQTHEEAAKVSGVYRQDRGLMRQRAAAALDVLARHPLADAERLAAIGYCFGGAAALELARSGADLDAVVTFHGSLSTPNPEDARHIRGRVLVLHGADDPFIKPEEVEAFESAMREAGVPYQIVRYPGAVHSFTVPEAGNDPAQGMAYNADADRASWDAMKALFESVFQLTA